MKSSRSFLIISMVIAGVFSLFACKKKDNFTSVSARIASMDIAHGTTRAHYRMVYDSYSNLDSMVIIGGGTDTGHYAFKKFDYFGTSYSITDQNGYKITVYASNTGLVLKVLQADTISLTYTGNVVTKADFFQSALSYHYTWADNDAITVTSPAVTSTYTYDHSKSGQIGDPLRIDDFRNYGRPYIKTKHLPITKSYNGAAFEKYIYTFDNQGRVTQLTKIFNLNTVPDTTFYTYRY